MTTGSLPPISITTTDRDRLSSLISSYIAIGREEQVAVLEADLERARTAPPAAIGPNVVTMGSQVSYRDEATGAVRTVTLVYPDEEDIAAGRISVLTPVGSALLGLSVGQSIDWETRDGRSKTLTVVAVKPGRPEDSVAREE